MSVASDTYFAGPMQPNSYQYGYANRQIQPQQHASGNMYQQFPPPQPYPSSGLSATYGSPSNGTMPNYHHESHAPPSYLPGVPGSARQSHSRSSSHPSSSMAAEPVFSPSDSIPGSDNERQVRVVSSRPRPQCWDHGCNGREFSTFSNLLRHQREKSGVVAKAECPVCGAVFTRTTARNIHVAQGKCKGASRDPSAE
ncbi:hypothetical protein N7520_006509 [Penicillium odoratum]|uniref:uncharacterized protein n=1 Tax=Penicillium odoratum TaxID=1167516 RepID=UPI002546B916|nr:uncharacterized protein N7520_006509 [Penicillium odoratum]KAJ5759353.1 hypothetical protein N7520_006509 [Penicillium odoratum]